MLVITWIAIMLVASAETYFLLTDRLPAVVGPMIGLFLGFTAAYGALGLQINDASAGVTGAGEPALAFLGVAVVVLNMVYLFSDGVATLPSGITGGR